MKSKKDMVAGGSVVSRDRPGRLRRWQFRLMALGLPLVLVLAVEGLLRLGGYGYPTGFFLEAGPGRLKENHDFTRRYFPAGLHRSPHPALLRAVKEPGVYRIFLLGESAAMGDPEPSYGFGRILELMLEERYRGTDFEVVNVAVTAINSHVIRDIARDCVGLGGDLWIVYMGNNEVVGPFGAGTVFGEQVPGLGVIRAGLALKRTRLGQWVDSLKRGGKGMPVRWEGMEMFMDQAVRRDDPRMAVVYDHFQRNLGEIIRMGLGSGAKVIVGTVASNLRDSAPFGSGHGAGMTAADLAGWEAAYGKGAVLAGEQDFGGALEQYRAAESIDREHAELQFRIGRCLLSLGRPEEAVDHFRRARDLDTLRFRADTVLNDRIREVVGSLAAPGLRLVDLERVCGERSAGGLAGDELFYEHVHFTFAGNHLIARALLDQVAGMLPESMEGLGGNLEVEECGERLGWSRWDQNRVMEEMVERLAQPPFTGRMDHERQQAHRRERFFSNRAGYGALSLEADLRMYEAAVAGRTNDWVLRENAARFLEANQRLVEAGEQWRRVTELLPHYAPGFFGLGNNLDLRGLSGEALPHLREALRLRPEAPEARTGLGLVLSNLGKLEEAKREYELVIATRPDYARARINLGQLLAGEGNVDAARFQYGEALRWQSNSVAARINLGKLLVQSGDAEGALAHYREALRIEPQNALVHYNLGNALAAGRHPEALGHYLEAVRLDPGFVAARYNLGLEFSEARRYGEAQVQFEAVLDQRPDFIEARLNLGVALAKQERFSEAAGQFQETLKRDPGNVDAQRFLQQALERGRGATPNVER